MIVTFEALPLLGYWCQAATKRCPLFLYCDLWGAMFHIFYPPAGSTNAEMLPL